MPADGAAAHAEAAAPPTLAGINPAPQVLAPSRPVPLLRRRARPACYSVGPALCRPAEPRLSPRRRPQPCLSRSNKKGSPKAAFFLRSLQQSVINRTAATDTGLAANGEGVERVALLLGIRALVGDREEPDGGEGQRDGQDARVRERH